MDTAHSGNTYLVTYGASGTLGCFVAENNAVDYSRGNRVLIRSERGLEEGTVLATSHTLGQFAGIQITPGIILGPAEHRMADSPDAQVEDLFADARKLAQEKSLPLSVIDMEVLFEPKTAIVHVLCYQPFDCSALQTMLSGRWSMRVIIHDTTNPEALQEQADTGCQTCGASGGCGSKKCSTGGCSTGSCGSGVGTPKQFQQQWKDYFADLRKGMERRHEDLPGTFQGS